MKKYIYKFIFAVALIVIFAPMTAIAAIAADTRPPTNITANSATLNGIASASSGVGLNAPQPIIYAKFRYTTTDTPLNNCGSMQNYTETPNMQVQSGLPYQRTITGLQPNTTYYYCTIAQHLNPPFGSIGSNLAVGQVVYFTTTTNIPLPPPPSGSGPLPGATPGDVSSVTTDGVENVSDIQATFKGTASGVSGTVYGYFRYASMDTPPIFCNDIYGSNMRTAAAGLALNNQSPSGRITGGPFSATVTNLTPSTTYYYCAFASNHASSPTVIKFGLVKSLTTPPCKTCAQTLIRTHPAIVLGSSSANLKGEYGSTKSVTTYFEYKSSELPMDWIKTEEVSHNENSRGRITSFVKGLRPNTYYVFRAVGRTENPTETFYGDNLFFRTSTEDGFGDGEGWVYDGTPPATIPPYTPGGPGGTDIDTDGDGTGNDIDLDDDNDGNNDVTDTDDDGDGILDVDDDNYGGNTGDGNTDGGSDGGYDDIGNGNGDFDGDGIGNGLDNDLDGDGTGNTSDSDTDGDGTGNGFDSDDDNDGIFDASDVTPLGNGSYSSDLDGDGLSNSVDSDDDGDGIPDGNDLTPLGTSNNLGDLDGDGISNSQDSDMDGDGIPNINDPDDDNDGLPDHLDNSPGGVLGSSGGNNQEGEPQIGDPTTPPSDAIVRYHEGVETVFIRQIMRNTTLAKKYGYRDGEDLQKFSWYLAHFLGRKFGYVAQNRKEVRVRYPDVAAYELREVGSSTTVYESFDSAKNGKFKITGIRKLNSLFKIIFKYEYYFLKRR